METPTIDGAPPLAGVPMFIAGGISFAQADALYLRKNVAQVAATDFLQMGATLPTSGAIRIDAASYGNIALHSKNGAMALRLYTSSGSSGVIADGTTALNLGANGMFKWGISSEAAGTATLASVEATARIVGGATNGLAIRNSAGTRDNFQIPDAGSSAILNNGARAGQIFLQAVSGELPAGIGIISNTATESVFLATPVGATSKVVLLYHDGTIYRSAAEAPNATGFSTLALMKSGGAVVIGTDPGGSNTLRVGGALLASSSLFAGAGAVIGFNGTSVISAPSDGILLLRNNAGTDFSRLQFGGTTTSFPSLKRTTTGLDVRLADDSGWGFLQAGTLAAIGTILSTGPTAGIGYTTGAGGTVTQITSKATDVTLDTVTGKITMHNASLAAGTVVSFVLTSSAIAAADQIVVTHEAAGTGGAYGFSTFPAAGSCTVYVRNNTAGALAEAIVLRFFVNKSVNA